MTIQVTVNVSGELTVHHYVECEEYLPLSEALTIAEETVSNHLYADSVVYQSLQSSLVGAL